MAHRLHDLKRPAPANLYFPRLSHQDAHINMSNRYYQHQFPSGLTLLAEQMPAMQSAAMTLLIPAGSSVDPQGYSGAANVMSDLLLRGAGDLDSRALTNHLDTLGLQRSSSAGVYHM